MGSPVRKTRNYKEKSSMLALGHIALPLAAVIALGLLFLGIRLFFLSPSTEGVVEITPSSVQQVERAEVARPADVKKDEPVYTPSQEEKVESSSVETDVVLASPGGSGTSTHSSNASSTTPRTTQKPKQQTTAVASTKPTTPAKTQPATQRTSGSAAFGVQIGSFAERARADSVVAEVGKLGYTATVSHVQTNGKNYYRVRVHSGANRENAERMASELEKKGYPVLVVSNP